MAPLIIAVLYGLAFLLVKLGAGLEMNNELRIAFNLIAGIGALIAPMFVYSIIDQRLTQRAINHIGKQWCKENAHEFQKTEIRKNHITLTYGDAGKKLKRQFRVHFVFSTWQVKSVEWLEN